MIVMCADKIMGGGGEWFPLKFFRFMNTFSMLKKEMFSLNSLNPNYLDVCQISGIITNDGHQQFNHEFLLLIKMRVFILLHIFHLSLICF